MDGTTGAHTRRDLLKVGGALALGWMLGPELAEAARSPVRTLSLYSIHTGESVKADYFVDGRYQPAELEAIDRVMRDHRTGTIHPMDPAVLDIMFAVRRALGTPEAFHVVSGYRTRQTNETNRLRSRHSGVAKDSFHLYGRAVDVYVPSRDLTQLRRVALALRAGGVGYYPRSGFVHLDTGPFRTW
jgi:uncharacterized protein YcbK (DUF882 family)